MNTPVVAIKTGDWKAAQKATAAEISHDQSSRRWMLSRMRAGVCALDAGDTRAALAHFSESYGIIRTQGLNADRTIPAYLVNESVKIWKGEPFEQALMLAYYGVLQAQLNSWDNCRAASDNALFSLRDLENTGGDGLSPAAVAARSRAYEDARARGLSEEEAKAEAEKISPKNGYLTTPTDFALGHLLMAISAQQMKRPDEAAAHFDRVAELRPELAADLRTLRSDDYNAVLVVAYGLGPRKEAFSPNGNGALDDKTCTRYAPQTADDPLERLTVAVEGGETGSHPPILNLNHMAADHRWRDLEDVRKIKSVIGNVAAISGTYVLLHGLGRGKKEEIIVGAALATIGILAKATAHAQTEYCDTFPQRMFVVPMRLAKPAVVRVSLPGHAEASDAIIVNPPKNPQGEATMTYLRLPGY